MTALYKFVAEIHPSDIIYKIQRKIIARNEKPYAKSSTTCKNSPLFPFKAQDEAL